MKTKLVTLLTLVLLVAACKTTYKIGQCDQLFLDLEKGTLNGIPGTASMDEVKKAFPCFTGETEEGYSGNCGGGVFFLDHDYYFYTHRDYIEVRNNFAGTISHPVFGFSQEQLFEKFGEPDLTLSSKVFTDDKDFDYEYEYSREWGVLSFKTDNGVIYRIQCFYGKKVGEVDHCL